MDHTVTVDKKNRVTLPADLLEELHLEPGDELVVSVQGGELKLRPDPLRHLRKLRGLHREIWDGVDIDEYIRQERDAWSK